MRGAGVGRERYFLIHIRSRDALISDSRPKYGSTMRPFVLCLSAMLAAYVMTGSAVAQSRKPTAAEIAAIRDCAKAKADTEDGGESCQFRIVAEPCTKTEAGQSNLGMADCYAIEQAIWDILLNENYRRLRDDLDDRDQEMKLREMQRAWIAARDRTCEFYHHKIRGSMSIPMSAACLLRETARRALLLQALDGL
jgi:uncharacterized protein YecT (DUF1311 family)